MLPIKYNWMVFPAIFGSLIFTACAVCTPILLTSCQLGRVHCCTLLYIVIQSSCQQYRQRMAMQCMAILIIKTGAVLPETLCLQFDYFVVYPLSGSICQKNIACETYILQLKSENIKNIQLHFGTALLTRNCKGALDALWMMLRAMVASTKINVHIQIIEKRWKARATYPWWHVFSQLLWVCLKIAYLWSNHESGNFG